jgi:uncharacterized membrane protein YfcA
MAVTPSVFAVVAVAALLIGLSKGGLGGGLGPLITILVALVVPADVAIGLLLPLLMVGDVTALVAHRGRWDRELLVRLLPGAVVGVAIASVALRGVTTDALRVVLAVVVLATVAYKVLEPRLGGRAVEVRPWHGALAGLVSGVTSTVAHVGGPPVVVYLVLARTPAVSYVATLAVFFTVVNWIKVPGYLAADLFEWELLWRLAPTAALIPVGTVVGRWAVHRVEQRTFDRTVLGLLVAGAALLLVG